MTTATEKLTIQGALNEANPGRAWSAVQKAKLGDTLVGLQKTITIASAASAVLTDIDDPDDTSKKLPAALVIGSVRVVTGTATGRRDVSDAGDTPSATLATLSDDGKTITFEAVITVFRINYIPKEDLTVDFENE